MDERELRERLQALEARLARLEARFGVAAEPAREPTQEPAREPVREPPPLPTAAEHVSPSATPFAPPPGVLAPEPLPSHAPRLSERRAARIAAERAAKRDLERFVGLTVLGRAGVAALLLAAAYFGQLGWAHLGPLERAAVVYLAGGAMLGVGALLRARVAARYTALLWGGGVAMIYLAGVLAHLVFEVMSSPVAIVSLLATTAVGQFLARVLALEAFATVALAGAYAAPVLVGTPSATPTAFFTLLLALHAWAAWTEHRWRWHSARALAVVATVLLAWGWYSLRGTVGLWSFALHTLALWLGLAAPELIAAVRRRPVASPRAVFVGVGLFVVLASVFGVGRSDAAQCALLLSAAALIVGALLRPRALELGTWIARAGSLVLACAFTAWWHPGSTPPSVFAGLLAVAAALFATRRWTGVGDFGASLAVVCTVQGAAWARWTDEPGFVWLLGAATPLLVLAVSMHTPARFVGLVGGVLFAFECYGGSFAGPDAGWAGLAVALASGTATLAQFVGARSRDRVLMSAAWVMHVLVLVVWFVASQSGAFVGFGPFVRPLASAELTPLWNARTGAMLAIVVAALFGRSRIPAAEGQPRAVLGATALVGTYLAGLLELLDAVAGWQFGARSIASSLYTLAFAALLLVAGFRRQLPALRWTALIAFGCVAVKVVAWDLREVDTPLRVLATGVLGGVLLVAAWAYARRPRCVSAPSDP